jgi:ankyrin repeat protein
MKRMARVVAAALAAMVSSPAAIACEDPAHPCPWSQETVFPAPAEDLLAAALYGDRRRVETLARQSPETLRATNALGETLLETILHLAARHEDAGWLKILLAARADPNTANLPHDEYPLIGTSRPLGAALMAGRDRQFRMLIDAGADVKAADRTGNTPLHLAAQINQPWQALALLKAGADPAARNAQGQRFDRYLFMTPDHLLTRHNRDGRRAVRAWLAAQGIPL